MRSKNRCWKSYIPSISVTKNYDDIVGGKFEKYFATIDSTDFSLQSIMTEPPFMMEHNSLHCFRTI
jgi:hypothetical protein